jgi:hypothetical protein
MSIYPTWSRLVRQTLISAGCKLSHGQAMEILAAGLGHKTYASFKQHDEASLFSARFVVVSYENMQARAHDFKVLIQSDQCHGILRALRESANEEGVSRRIHRLETAASLAWNETDEFECPETKAIARANNLSFDGVTVLYKKPNEALKFDSDAWSWTVNGSVHGQTEGIDFDIPFEAQVTFHKKGRHLMSQGVISRIEQNGPRMESSDDFVEGYVSDSNL